MMALNIIQDFSSRIGGRACLRKCEPAVFLLHQAIGAVE